ncbi:Uncharacterized protein APZ42_023201 [Daphnia magna]|uniref:Uncharacterized protein n=1 Tax=Daphnia magna TaxID=35525 RepID=A0A162DHW8_9CRUS|nr:Uncharacterized protein APZ42_023201 [Daphnia magna]
MASYYFISQKKKCIPVKFESPRVICPNIFMRGGGSCSASCGFLGMLGTKSLLQLKEIKYLKFYRNKCNSFMGSNPRKKIVSLVCKRLGPNTVLCPSVCVYDVRAEFDFFYP